MRRLALAVVASALVACRGPAVLWAGRTPDRARTVEVIADAGLQYVVVDGQRRAGYRAIAAWSIAFAGGHLAFAARLGGGWVVVADGVAGPGWDAIGELALTASGRLAYAAARDGAWRVVVDGRAGPRFASLLAGTLGFSADGRRVAYVVDDGGARAVIDGVIGPRFDGVGQLAFSADGARAAYAARRGARAYVVVDGVVGPAWDAVAQLALSARGGRVAYAARDGDRWRVVRDGEPGPAVDALHRIVLRDDGAHVAWIATVAGGDVLALDGAPVAAAPRLRDEAVGFRPGGGDGVGLAYVAPSDEPGGGERVVIDGVAGPRFDEVGAPVWSGDGRVGYAARRGDAWVMVVAGRELAGGAWVGAPVFSPDGRRVAYLARQGRAWLAIVDGHAHRFELVFDGSLAFSADGRHWALLAGDLAREQLFFAVDGATRVPLPAIEIYSAAARRTPSPLARPDELLRDWSRAEAERGVAGASAIRPGR